MDKGMIELGDYMGSRELKIRAGFRGLGGQWSHAESCAHKHPQLYDVRLLSILKFLLISSLNWCFLSEGQWDRGARVGAEEVHAVCVSGVPRCLIHREQEHS